MRRPANRIDSRVFCFALILPPTVRFTIVETDIHSSKTNFHPIDTDIHSLLPDFHGHEHENQ